MKIDHLHPRILRSRFDNPGAGAVAINLPFWFDSRTAADAVAVTMASGVPDAAAVFVAGERRVTMIGKSPWPGAIKAFADLAIRHDATSLLGEDTLVQAVASALAWPDLSLDRRQILTTRGLTPLKPAASIDLRVPLVGELDLLASWLAAAGAKTPHDESWREFLDYLTGDRRLLVATDPTDEPAAMSSWNRFNQIDMDAGVAIDVIDLTNVLVRPDRRLGGLGRSLIEGLLARVTASPPSYGRRDAAVVARIDAANGTAQTFWGKLGFAAHGIWETWRRS